MRLKEFRVYEYRSIEDSEPVKVENLTVLIGRNESGKSNLLRALYLLNPDDKKNLPDGKRDFPRHKLQSDCKYNTPFINSTWELEKDELKEIEGICPRNLRSINLKRNYQGASYFELTWEHPIISEPDEKKIQEIKGYLLSSLSEWFHSLTNDGQRIFKESYQDLETLLTTMENFNEENYIRWASHYVDIIEDLYDLLKKQEVDITDTCTTHIKHLKTFAETIGREEPPVGQAKHWLMKKIPTFIYAHDYPKIYGEYSLNDIWRRKARREQNSETKDEDADTSFERLCQAAEIKPENIPPYNKDINNHRDDLMGSASRGLTKKVNGLWHNAQLKVILRRYGDWLNIYIKKEEGSASQGDEPAEIHLDQQSAGFQWFFSFYVTFAAQTDFGSIEKNIILLLDEPGLHLHPQSQDDLLQHFRTDFKNQIIYTTHSPFMIPNRPKEVRIVDLGDDGTTKVKENSKDNRKNLFAYEVALRINLSHSIRIDPYTLIVEGKTDDWILNTVSEYFQEQGKEGIPEGMAVQHVCGTGEIQYFARRLSPEKVGVMVLVDRDKAGLREEKILKFSKIARPENVITIACAFKENLNQDADIEDVLGDDILRKLVRHSYEKFAKYDDEHPGKVDAILDAILTENLKENKENLKTPRIMDRYKKMIRELKKEDKEFGGLKIKLNKKTLIDTFCELMLVPEEAKNLMSEEVVERFDRLFKRIRQIKDTKA